MAAEEGFQFWWAPSVRCWRLYNPDDPDCEAVYLTSQELREMTPAQFLGYMARLIAC